MQNIYKKINELLDNYSLNDKNKNEDKIIFKKNIMNLLDDFYIKKSDLYEMTKVNVLYLIENYNYENKLIYKKDILNYIEPLYNKQIIEE